MKKMMVFLMMAFLTLGAFAQQRDVQSMLENEQTREEIFNAIANDPELMREFRQVMAEQGPMRGDEPMMRRDRMRMHQPGQAVADSLRMMDHDQMQGMMRDNPEMMERMVENMMQLAEDDPQMQERMARHMADHPQVMRSLMDYMRENDMMDEEGNPRMRPSPRRD